MKDIVNIKKILIWLPAVFIIIIILALTFQSPEKTGTLSMSVQEATVSTVSNVGIDRKKAIQCWWYNFSNFRKLAHIGEYFPLGISVAIPFCLIHKKKPIIFSFFICVIVSLIDQILKGILPTREFDEKDLMLDLIGYAMGILLTAIFIKIGSEKKKRDAQRHTLSDTAKVKNVNGKDNIT